MKYVMFGFYVKLPFNNDFCLNRRSNSAGSKLIGNQKKQHTTRPSSAKVQNKIIPDSPSNENQLSAMRTRHLSGSKLSAEALKINCNVGEMFLLPFSCCLHKCKNIKTRKISFMCIIIIRLFNPTAVVVVSRPCHSSVLCSWQFFSALHKSKEP